MSNHIPLKLILVSYADDVMCFFRDGERSVYEMCSRYSRTVWSLRVCWTSETSSRDQTTGDPVHKSAHVGVDARLVLLSATVSPAHHPYNVLGLITLAHQRASRVALRRDKAGGYHQGATRRKKKQTNWNPVVFKPGRSRRLRSCCLRRTCCRPVSPRTRGELCISPGRWGQRERPAAGWSRTSLRRTEQQQRWRSVDFESILRCSYHGKNHSTGLLLFVYCNSKIHLIFAFANFSYLSTTLLTTLIHSSTKDDSQYNKKTNSALQVDVEYVTLFPDVNARYRPRWIGWISMSCQSPKHFQI